MCSLFSIDRFKQKLLLIPSSRRLIDILEAVRVSDFIVLLMSASVEVDQQGTLALTAIKAQGVPVLMGAVQVCVLIETLYHIDLFLYTWGLTPFVVLINYSILRWILQKCKQQYENRC